MQFGQIYKRFEKYDKINNYAYFAFIILIQCILLQKFNLSYNLNILHFKNNYIINLIGSITGILFWLRVSKILVKYIGDNKIINKIGNSTYTIMMHHVFIFFMINSVILILNKLTNRFGKFNINSFKNSCWYFYNENNQAMLLIYTLLAIFIPLLLKDLIVFIKNKIIFYFKNIKIRKIESSYN